MATGRSDYPNQINKRGLAFPGIFRGPRWDVRGGRDHRAHE